MKVCGRSEKKKGVQSSQRQEHEVWGRLKEVEAWNSRGRVGRTPLPKSLDFTL